jgi:hypothetical protein
MHMCLRKWFHNQEKARNPKDLSKEIGNPTRRLKGKNFSLLVWEICWEIIRKGLEVVFA